MLRLVLQQTHLDRIIYTFRDGVVCLVSILELLAPSDVQSWLAFPLVQVWIQLCLVMLLAMRDLTADMVAIVLATLSMIVILLLLLLLLVQVFIHF